jgi:RsiW-degrading membrane proteinase PrsW (M82 family)
MALASDTVRLQHTLVEKLNEGDVFLSEQRSQEALDVLLEVAVLPTLTSLIFNRRLNAQAHAIAESIYASQPAGQIPALTLLGSAHLGMICSLSLAQY